MRKYIRHPSDIPIEFSRANIRATEADQLIDVGYGGLSFNSRRAIRAGSILTIRIRLVHPAFEARGRVAWCRRVGDHFRLGVAFLDEDDIFRARMVEQICYIEKYKRDIGEVEGRTLSSEEAAKEWIAKYAGAVPGFDSLVGR